VRVLKIVVALLLLALAACDIGASNIGKPVSDGDLMQIAEAIMVKQYRLPEPYGRGPRIDVFVAIHGKATPAELLTRLTNARVRFRPGNEYKPGLGTSLTISNFIWTDSNHAKGDIGEVCGPLCGQGNAIVMVRKGGNWMVESMTPTWIS
jgi:hypothetical protein